MTDQEEQAFIRVVRDVARARIEPEASDVDERSRFPENGYRALASVGLLVLHLPETLGGGGAGMATSTVAIEEVARSCGSTAAVIAATVQVSTALGRVSIELARPLIEQIATGDQVAAWVGEGITYTAAGTGYVLEGRGTWVANADRAQSLVVVANADGATGPGIAMLLVRTDQAGVRVGEIEADLGLRGCSLRSVELTGVLVTEANLLLEGPSARAAVDCVAAHHGLSIAALAVGVGQGALDEARAYVLDRIQFGRRIADFPAIRAILAEAVLRVDGARQLVKKAAAEVDRGVLREDTVSGALLAATEAAATVTIDAVQAFGGYGYVKDYPVERMMRDAHAARLLMGSRAERLESIACHFLASTNS